MTQPHGQDGLPLAEQRALWLRQSASLPALHGGKRAWLGLVIELASQVDAGKGTAMDAHPELPDQVFGDANKRPGAPTAREAQSWAEYSRFLRAAGLVSVDGSTLTLTKVGHEFLRTGSPEVLGASLSRSFRLLAESLQHISHEPVTVEDLDDYLRSAFHTDWKSLGGVRARTDWLDALGAIEAIPGRRWMITEVGKELLAKCDLVTPDALAIASDAAGPVEPAPAPIQELLNELADGTRAQATRSTYNIWVPSPASRPNKVENLRVIVNAVVDPLDRAEFLEFITDTFNLRRSSVDSMLPFLRASGLISEVSLGVYQASPGARAWLQTGNDIDFIRLLHANMRFVGEMIRATQDGATRADVYAEAERHGLNVDKSRWIAAFLQDAGLIMPPKYGSLRATPTGIALLTELPLATPEGLTDTAVGATTSALDTPTPIPVTSAESLDALSRTPMAAGQGSGKAFEQAISDTFTRMGFDSRTISGSGATDVLVTWRDDSGALRTATVEAKSRAGGSISHTDISDVALETHRTRHAADRVAIIATAFSGDTIKTMAAARSWTLIEAAALGSIADAVISLGLGPEVSGALFDDDGLSTVRAAIQERRRELAVLSFVVAQLADEAAETGDPITPRDMSRDGRRTEIQPSIDEVLSALATLQDAAPGAVRMVDENGDPRFSSFELGNPRSAASTLRAIADAIEAPLSGTA